MKKFIKIFILSVLCTALQGQEYPDIKRTWIWYFGFGAGLDFSGGTPVAVTNGQSYSLESSAVMSDKNGNFLFYTNGETVWNREHQIMQNGTNLLGCGGAYMGSASQGCLIVPKPLNDNIYYIFVVDCGENQGASGLSYSIVDMNLDNGLGGVTLKNVILYTPTTERLTATFHCNKKDIWVVSHELWSDKFYSYLVTDTGVNHEPVITQIGIDYGGNFGSSGFLKFSPNSRKLLSVNSTNDPYYNSSIELFDFDNSNGIINNRMQLSDDTYLYGASWSPDGSKFYVATFLQLSNNNIFQYDVSSDDQQIIVSTKTIISNLDSLEFCFQIQAAPDGKLYIARVSELSSDSLAIIHEPNNPGISCNFVFNGISLQNREVVWGLPNFIDSYFYDNTIQNVCDTINDNELQIFIPNIFSPNGDGINDILYVRGKGIEKLIFSIYNRWGEKIFETNDPACGWNGTFKGKNSDVGVYVYYVEAVMKNGEKITKTGDITLIR